MNLRHPEFMELIFEIRDAEEGDFSAELVKSAFAFTNLENILNSPATNHLHPKPVNTAPCFF